VELEEKATRKSTATPQQQVVGWSQVMMMVTARFPWTPFHCQAAEQCVEINHTVPLAPLALTGCPERVASSSLNAGNPRLMQQHKIVKRRRWWRWPVPPRR